MEITELERIKHHAHRYAEVTAGARFSVATAYARYYITIVEAEDNPFYWPPHSTEFWKWLYRHGWKDWRE